MDLLSFFRVLRRRWLVVLIAVLIGAGVGLASTLADSGPAKEQTYYKATNTLLLDQATGDSSIEQAFSTVEQISFLATTGDVPNDVAQELGSSDRGRELAKHVITLTDSVPSTLAITAVDENRERAVTLADLFAKALIADLDKRMEDRYNERQESLNQKLDQLKKQADDFLAQIVAAPTAPGADTLRKQYDATQNQFYSTYGAIQSLTAAGVPTGRLSSVDTAQAVPISEGEYDSRLSRGASGQNNMRAETAANGGDDAIATSSSSVGLNGRTSRVFFGGFLGLVIGVGLALVSERLDHRIRSRAQAEASYGLPVLAEVPKFTRQQQKANDVVAQIAPLSRVAEAYRAVRTSLLFQQASALAAERSGNGNGHGAALSPDALFEPEQQGNLVIMVSSASPREGKTNTSANLAAVFVETGSSVLVVNCDFRRPTIHNLLHVDDKPRTVQNTSVPGVKIVTNVTADPSANPAQVVAAQRQVLAAARERFDVIILDTAPILTANDAVELVGSADLLLLVARVELTTTDHAERTMEVLTRLEAPIGGVVLIGAAEISNDYYYYYQRNRVGGGDQRSTKRKGGATGPDRSADVAPVMFGEPADTPPA